ncbi:MAG: ubiquinone biosynthesis protein [Sphingomonadales bacterium]|nr:ubiquinone biosynthesis protein [Sphingomonadales bacterium]
MASRSFNPAVPMKRQWGAALTALRRLLADGDDTVQVFRIMRALNADTTHRNYRRLIASLEGGRLAYERVELAPRFCDRAWIESFPEGSVGAAYRAFLDRTGYSADGLVEVSVADTEIPRNVEHPYAWFGRRERDIHDIWHVLTGYEADEPLGEACLVAFSYAQTGGLGWAAIAVGAALKSLRITGNSAFARAVWEGWRHGRRAAWLHLEDYEALMAEPLDGARARLRIAEPARYREARRRLAAAGLSGI